MKHAIENATGSRTDSRGSGTGEGCNLLRQVFKGLPVSICLGGCGHVLVINFAPNTAGRYIFETLTLFGISILGFEEMPSPKF